MNIFQPTVTGSLAVTGSISVIGDVSATTLTGTSSLATTAINARTPSQIALTALGSVIKAEPLWGGWSKRT